MIGDRLVVPTTVIEPATTIQAAPERMLRTRMEPAAGGGTGHHGPAHPGTAEGREAARLRALLSDPAIRVNMHQDTTTGHLVMQVESRATGEMVEQIPSESLLRLYQALRESLVDEQV